MKKNSFVLLGLMIIPLTLFALSNQKASHSSFLRERNLVVHIEKLETGAIKLSWNEVSDAVAYKIYSAPTPDVETFSLVTEVDASELFYQFEPQTDNEFYYLTYVEESSGGTVTDIDGNVYQTLVFGNQEWMVENLRVTHYRDGHPISHYPNVDDWQTANDGAYCFFDNDLDNVEIYGFLYNRHAVLGARGLAPEGWRIPSDEDVMELEMYLGMSETEANALGFRGTNEGSKLAGGYELWDAGALRNDPEFNSSGFNFLPGGFRQSNGAFWRLGIVGHIWTSTVTGNVYGRNRELSNNRTNIHRDRRYMSDGLSVRCVRDVD